MSVLQIGILYMKNKKFKQAVEIFKSLLPISNGVLDSEPFDNYRIYYNLAICYLELATFEMDKEDSWHRADGLNFAFFESLEFLVRAKALCFTGVLSSITSISSKSHELFDLLSIRYKAIIDTLCGVYLKCKMPDMAVRVCLEGLLFNLVMNSCIDLTEFVKRVEITLGDIGTTLKALMYQAALATLPSSSECMFNLNIALRQLGKLNEAIALSWFISNVRHEPICNQCACSVSNDCTRVLFVCVKWGTKYDYSYVNNLYIGLCRYYSSALDAFLLICLTDDPSGIHDNVKCLPLFEDAACENSHNSGLTGWWS